MISSELSSPSRPRQILAQRMSGFVTNMCQYDVTVGITRSEVIFFSFPRSTKNGAKERVEVRHPLRCNRTLPRDRSELLLRGQGRVRDGQRVERGGCGKDLRCIWTSPRFVIMRLANIYTNTRNKCNK